MSSIVTTIIYRCIIFNADKDILLDNYFLFLPMKQVLEFTCNSRFLILMWFFFDRLVIYYSHYVQHPHRRIYHCFIFPSDKEILPGEVIGPYYFYINVFVTYMYISQSMKMQKLFLILRFNFTGFLKIHCKNLHGLFGTLKCHSKV